MCSSAAPERDKVRDKRRGVNGYPLGVAVVKVASVSFIDFATVVEITSRVPSTKVNSDLM